VRADKNIKIALAIKGWPVLIVNWQHSDKDIYKDDCNNIETNNDQALLVVKDAKRGDTGPYTVILKNPSGSAEVTVKVNVLNKPGTPQGPLEAMETTPTAIKLQWKPTKDDRGSKIERYMLEKNLKVSNNWMKCPGGFDPNQTDATAKNLKEGQEYDFRVMAVNKEAEIEPRVNTAPIKAIHSIVLTNLANRSAKERPKIPLH